jgi:ParB family chromosome partitioning protein
MPKPKATQKADAQAVDAQGRMMEVPVVAIREPTLPARENMDSEKLDDLCESMQAIGLQQPIVIRECSTGYEIVAGHRRLLAARRLKWEVIRAIVYPECWELAAAAMIHENTVREDLNPAAEAILYAQLIESRHLDEGGICALVRRSPDYIAGRLGLLRGSREVMEAVRCNAITLAVARILNRFPDDYWRKYYLDAAIRAGTSARVVQQWLDAFEVQDTGTPQAAYQAHVEQVVAQQIETSKPSCLLCGGDRDPWNLKPCYIHAWEIALVNDTIAAKAREALDAAEEGARADQADVKKTKIN